MGVGGSCTGYSIIDASCYPNYAPIGNTTSISSVPYTWNGGSPWINGRPSSVIQATANHYLNPAAFVNAPAGTYGNAARTAPDGLFAPRYGDVDLSVRKTVSLWESAKFVIQADAFNVSNSVYFTAPNTTVGSSSFGEYSAAANSPRKMQLSARFTF